MIFIKLQCCLSHVAFACEKWIVQLKFYAYDTKISHLITSPNECKCGYYYSECYVRLP